MFRQVLLRVFCLLALVSSAIAQIAGSASLRIQVTYGNGLVASGNVMVRLMAGAGNTPIATSYTNDAGMAEFNQVAIGAYHVTVTGEGFQSTESAVFEVDARQIQTEYVAVERGDRKVAPSNGMVDAAELRIPEDARKQFQKAAQAMSREDWNQARDALGKAVERYPQYAAAYNNLGIVYSRLADSKRANEALQKAISADQHFAPAYVNLGELCIRQSDYKRAEATLTRAVALDPRDAKALMLLADAQLLNQEYDAAIETAKRAHTLPHDRLALTHYISAKAYEHENRRQDAIAQLQLFLQEEPQGTRADHMRDEIKQLQRYSKGD
jgi:tetratricopeptide (TPR) repeat protein